MISYSFTQFIITMRLYQMMRIRQRWLLLSRQIQWFSLSFVMDVLLLKNVLSQSRTLSLKKIDFFFVNWIKSWDNNTIWFHSIAMIFWRLSDALLFWGLLATQDLVTLLTLLWDSPAPASKALWKTRSTGVAPPRWTHVACSADSILLALVLTIGVIFSVNSFSDMAHSCCCCGGGGGCRRLEHLRC